MVLFLYDVYVVRIMESLFSEKQSIYKPLAVRMRPKRLDDFFGQKKVVGPGSFLRAMIEKDQVPSLLLYGPSGTGKTTLAMIIAEITHSHFVALNATNTGIGDLRKIAEEAKKRIDILQERTILFLDEIHRFNKGQQDVLLPFVEDGTIVLVGATTENPFFEVNRALLSRLKLLVLEPLSKEDIAHVLSRALTDRKEGLGDLGITAKEETLLAMGAFAGGDARMALNMLEQVAAMLPDGSELTIEALESVVGRRIQSYDKKGDTHYDVASAFIKSMRGSDVQATLHYLARMIDAGEDPNFIARRIVICAAEDVGLADPQALVIANAAAQASHFVGFPEARIILSEAAIYVAMAEKSNSAYMAIDRALEDVRHKDIGVIPLHLRDAHYGGAKELSHGKGYKYAHAYPKGYVEQQYLPDALKDAVYYEGIFRGKEKFALLAWKGRMEESEM